VRKSVLIQIDETKNVEEYLK